MKQKITCLARGGKCGAGASPRASLPSAASPRNANQPKPAELACKSARRVSPPAGEASADIDELLHVHKCMCYIRPEMHVREHRVWRRAMQLGKLERRRMPPM